MLLPAASVTPARILTWYVVPAEREADGVNRSVFASHEKTPETDGVMEKPAWAAAWLTLSLKRIRIGVVVAGRPEALSEGVEDTIEGAIVSTPASASAAPGGDPRTSTFPAASVARAQKRYRPSPWVGVKVNWNGAVASVKASGGVEQVAPCERNLTERATD